MNERTSTTVEELRRWHTLKGADCFRDAADQIEQLQGELLLRTTERDLARAQRADWKAIADSRAGRPSVGMAVVRPDTFEADALEWLHSQAEANPRSYEAAIEKLLADRIAQEANAMCEHGNGPTCRECASENRPEMGNG